MHKTDIPLAWGLCPACPCGVRALPGGVQLGPHSKAGCSMACQAVPLNEMLCNTKALLPGSGLPPGSPPRALAICWRPHGHYTRLPPGNPCNTLHAPVGWVECLGFHPLFRTPVPSRCWMRLSAGLGECCNAASETGSDQHLTTPPSTATLPCARHAGPSLSLPLPPSSLLCCSPEHVSIIGTVLVNGARPADAIALARPL